jgi:NADPH-dependent 2,4-dienoyl-CoA reductase/sulfur reductase-like enzyme
MELLMKHVILGNGPAGVIAAETIRHHCPNDEIVMLGSEPEPPYSRMAIPYLLMGNIQEDGTYLRKTQGHFEQLKVTDVRGLATHVNPKDQSVTLSDGQKIGYDRLLIATGSKPIRPEIPGIDLPGVHPCWTLDDARAIQKLAKEENLDFIFDKQTAQKIRDINDLAKDVYTSPPGSVNSSNTASVLLGLLDTAVSGLSGMPLPISTTINYSRQKLKSRALKKKVENALNP